MYLGTNFMPPVIHPTKQIVNHTFSTTVVPHIHPVHTTTVNHHLYQHKHYCPQTASCAEEVCNQQINCCNPCAPAAMPAAMPAANALPNAMPGMGGPGFGPGGPGFGPGGPGFGPGGPGFGPGGPGFGPGGPGFGPGGPGFGPGGPGFAPGPFMGPRR
ncbi:spore coat protein CotD [Bacillus sp. ISL-40]|uniref:CotD family spore coat protein n=1 Tax=unclassified Bacillus (in: firmicutes) TaxID=185979 RepID=UPI001BE57A88|nr:MULTISPECIES: CotD family spore coat protein [unclassified Bacillus (in: firmicutes)]MBT2701507.1 spore coat protein CotD [Bacillus sp. ISL-40]MBT2724387.1 spore coat protein CotD [Bacillus sp. ISL-46]MBT2739569.1 spore coat protein CotD [Bacillus sp. ISL-77]